MAVASPVVAVGRTRALVRQRNGRVECTIGTAHQWRHFAHAPVCREAYRRHVGRTAIHALVVEQILGAATLATELGRRRRENLAKIAIYVVASWTRHVCQGSRDNPPALAHDVLDAT